MKNNKNNDFDVLYGAHSIIEALRAKRRNVFRIYTTKPFPKAWKRIEKHIPQNKQLQIHHVDRVQLEKLAGTKHHMGVIAFATKFVYRKKVFDPKRNPLVLVLDSVQDVKNLGAILRTAHCTNFDAIVVADKNTAQITPDTVKASAGLCEYLEIIRTPSLSQTLKELKDVGYQLCFSVLQGGENVLKAKVEKPLCLVIGNEEKGIDPKISKLGIKITLPQKNEDISYNASVAAGILMFNISFK